MLPRAHNLLLKIYKFCFLIIKVAFLKNLDTRWIITFENTHDDLFCCIPKPTIHASVLTHRGEKDILYTTAAKRWVELWRHAFQDYFFKTRYGCGRCKESQGIVLLWDFYKFYCGICGIWSKSHCWWVLKSSETALYYGYSLTPLALWATIRVGRITSKNDQLQLKLLAKCVINYNCNFFQPWLRFTTISDACELFRFLFFPILYFHLHSVVWHFDLAKMHVLNFIGNFEFAFS